MPDLVLDPKSTALLAMDFQDDIFPGLADGETLLDHTVRLLDAARAAGVLVIYVTISFRPGYPEASDRNKAFGAIKRIGRFLATDPGIAIHAALAPKDGDVIVTKKRASAFSGSDLDMILRANGIETLILTGIITSGVVLSTLVHAADADYRPIVVPECCADRDPEVHTMLLGKIFPRLADVVPVAEVISALG